MRSEVRRAYPGGGDHELVGEARAERLAVFRSFLKADDVLESVTPDKLACGGYDMVLKLDGGKMPE